MRLAPRGALAAFALAVAATSAQAKVAPPAPVALRVAKADAVLVGKVAKLDPKPYKAPDGGEYAVAFVEVGDALSGVKGANLVRVAYHAGPNRRFPHLDLQPGQEALFFLRYLDDKDSTFTAPAYYDIVDKKNDAFATDLAEAKRCAKLLDAPEAGLTSKDADERYLTAAMLITQYRTPRDGAPGAAVPADPKLSKLILEALATADWQKGGMYQMMPMTLFNQLGVKDGWAPPADPAQFEAAAKKWLADNAGTYRVQRLVAPKK